MAVRAIDVSEQHEQALVAERNWALLQLVRAVNFGRSALSIARRDPALIDARIIRDRGFAEVSIGARRYRVTIERVG